LLAWSPLAFSAFDIPLEADRWKRQYLDQVNQVWGLRTPAWLASQVGQESSWRDGLQSSAGARGLCQFIEGTAEGIEKQYSGLAAWGRYSPRWCFYAQALLMRDLYGDYEEKRTRCNAIRFAGSAYNGGPRMLARETAICLTHEDCDPYDWEGVAKHNARASWAYRENRDYVRRITERESIYAALGWGVHYCKRP
jgi:soluble lytic murein transglycosylase-like protein